ncbi:Zinc finger protein [Oopsacas minuta]|uniref:Zinc finger protein n=1 Tax=Oopsacas minuta TaxID=111878 RepID=A0AAV7JXW6_9METZ|nr:Zinc finger protein [Oopsacas minuta]
MECLVCKHTFIRLGNYKRHLVKDHPNFTDIKTHSKGTTSVKRLVNKCPTCNKSYPSPHKLNLHNRIHLDTLAYPCTLCPDRFTTKTRLRLHTEGKHLLGEFKCLQCTQTFSSQLSMNRHNKVHSENKEKSQRTRDRTYECKVCGKKFSKSTDFTEHKQTHDEMKCYYCDMCDDTFTNKNSLRKHQICHSTEKPFKCECCGKCFARRGDLNVHSRKHTNTRNYNCHICNKSFFRSSHLKSHQKLHSRTLNCIKCGFESNQFTEFVQHRNSCKVKTHEKELDLSQLNESDFMNRPSPISIYSEDRPTLSPLLSDLSDEFDAEYQQLSLMSHTANEAVTQALKSVVHTPDIYDVTPTFSHYPFSYQPSEYPSTQFDEFMFPTNMHILGSGLRSVSSDDVITPLIGSYV